MNPQDTTPPQPPSQQPPLSSDGSPVSPYQQPAAPYRSAPPQPSSKKWVFWLVIWLAALPLGGVIAFVARFIFAQTSDASAAGVPAEVNIITLLLGLYGFLGWIPMLVSILRKK